MIILCPIWKVGGGSVVGIREAKKIMSVLKSFNTSLLCTAHDLISLMQASILETAEELVDYFRILLWSTDYISPHNV